VVVSLCHVLLRWLLEFVALRVRSMEFKELEIIVLRHELAILRRITRRPAITAIDRVAKCSMGSTTRRRAARAFNVSSSGNRQIRSLFDSLMRGYGTHAP
jgi:hypothetical protein